MRRAPPTGAGPRLGLPFVVHVDSFLACPSRTSSCLRPGVYASNPIRCKPSGDHDVISFVRFALLATFKLDDNVCGCSRSYTLVSRLGHYRTCRDRIGAHQLQLIAFTVVALAVWEHNRSAENPCMSIWVSRRRPDLSLKQAAARYEDATTLLSARMFVRGGLGRCG